MSKAVLFKVPGRRITALSFYCSVLVLVAGAKMIGDLGVEKNRFN